MTDKNNESALLLRMNKEEQVSVLQEIGFTSVKIYQMGWRAA